MDPRVGQLIADIQYAASVDGEVDPVMIRNEIVALYPDVQSEPDRVALIETFNRVTDLAARALSAQGRDTGPLESARLSQQRMFCVMEATEGGNVDPVKLWQAISREGRAGRMSLEDDFAKLAQAGAEVLTPPGPAKPKPAESAPRRGWFQRTFGA